MSINSRRAWIVHSVPLPNAIGGELLSVLGLASKARV